MMGFHPANFGLPTPFRCRVKVEACDRQTDGQTDADHHLIMPLPTEVWSTIKVSLTLYSSKQVLYEYMPNINVCIS